MADGSLLLSANKIINYVLSGLSLLDFIQNTISIKDETNYCAFDSEVICKHVCHQHNGDD